MTIAMLRAAERTGLTYEDSMIFRRDHPEYAVLTLGNGYVVNGRGKRLKSFDDPYSACNYMIEVINEVIYRSSRKT